MSSITHHETDLNGINSLNCLSGMFCSPGHISDYMYWQTVSNMSYSIRHWIVKFTSSVLCVTLVSRASSAPEIIVPPSCVVSECGWWPLGQRPHPAWTGPGKHPAAPGPDGQKTQRTTEEFKPHVELPTILFQCFQRLKCCSANFDRLNQRV